jgi:DNA end-binding protein Ku
VLVPGKEAEKGYVLFRETLKRAGKIGIARVVIRTREYLSAVMPKGDALMLMLLRYPQELVDTSDYKIPEGAASKHRISPKEMQMAEQLIDSMSGEWKPDDYRDEFRHRLRKVIEKRLKSKGVVTPPTDADADMPENATTNVVDFMALLQKSLASKRRTPAKKDATKSSRKTAAKKTSIAKKAGAKKTSRKRTTSRKAS